MHKQAGSFITPTAYTYTYTYTCLLVKASCGYNSNLRIPCSLSEPSHITTEV